MLLDGLPTSNRQTNERFAKVDSRKASQKIMNQAIKSYNDNLPSEHRVIGAKLASVIDSHLKATENKIWHGHPVWFVSGNPIVGYSLQKPGVRLMFWSGQSFDELGLDVHGKKFKDASVFYNSPEEVNEKDLKRWLKKSEDIQWDYKNIVKRKGKLERIP